MYQAQAALKQFFSGFGIPAYTEDTVPEDVSLPYITYAAGQPEWDQKSTLYAQIWDRSRSNSFILTKADEIDRAVGQGLKIDLEEGYLVIWPETPRSQVRTDGDYRSAYLNFSVNVYQTPGQ